MKYLKLYENLSNYIYLVIELLLSDKNLHYVIRTTKNSLKNAEENMEKLNAMLDYDEFYLYPDDNINNQLIEDASGVDYTTLRCKDFKIIYKIENKEEAIKKLKMILTTNKYKLL